METKNLITNNLMKKYDSLKSNKEPTVSPINDFFVKITAEHLVINLVIYN